MFTKPWLYLATLSFSALLATPDAALGQVRHSTSQLIAKLSSAKAAENFLQALNQSSSPEHALRYAQSGGPSKVRSLVIARLAPERLSEADPVARMHRWVVLEYQTADAAENGRRVMLANPAIFEQVVRDIPHEGSFSAIPTDPFYGYSHSGYTGISGASGYAVHSLMGFQSAWDFVSGYAYVADVDNGIQSLHEDLIANVRVHFSSVPMEEPGAGVKRGHGTHTAGLIAAGAFNGAGTAGGCWSCSLMVMRITDDNTSYTCSSAVSGIYTAVMSGAQVVNMSFGLDSECSGGTGPVEDVINLASSRQVSLSASAGNKLPTAPTAPPTQYPASNPYVMSIAATNGAGYPVSWSAGGKIDFAAPGEKVFSTFYTGSHWNDSPLDPGDYGTTCAADGNESAGSLNMYGFCSGTSMSSPLIAAAAALIRSANPLLSDAEVKSSLAAYANRHGAQSSQVGAGVPDVGDSVYNTLFGITGNGALTPLFAFQGGSPVNRFYTTVPQMASAAVNFGLRHGSIALTGVFGYTPAGAEGAAVSGYSSFPGAAGTPIAAANIITAINRYGRPTVALHRFSYADRSGEALHVYDNYPILTFANGFVRDGTEGYLYAPTSPQPYATVRMIRKYNPVSNRYALFPDSQLGYFANLGYTVTAGGTDTLGYACPNPLPNVGICRRAPRTDETSVDWFYMELLNRTADGGGYAFWLGQIRTSRCNNVNNVWATLDWVSSNLINGPEFQSRNLSNQAFVSAMYSGLVRRAPDAGGLSYWTGQLDSLALTRDQLRSNFIYSSEFYYGTVAPIINESCVA